MAHGRRGLLGAIHAGKRQLGWDDETYRAVLRQVTGHDSAAACTVRELEAVLEQLRARGFTPKPGAPAYRRGHRPEARYIRALWAELAQQGALHDPSEVGLNAFVERQTKTSRLEWCSTAQLRSVLEALKAWSTRVRHASP
jgi:phage gp16-like protein